MDANIEIALASLKTSNPTAAMHLENALLQLAEGGTPNDAVTCEQMLDTCAMNSHWLRAFPGGIAANLDAAVAYDHVAEAVRAAAGIRGFELDGE